MRRRIIGGAILACILCVAGSAWAQSTVDALRKRGAAKPATQGIQAVRILVQEDYGEYAGIRLAALHDLPRAIVEAAGYPYFTNWGGVADARIEVKMRGTPIQATYSDGVVRYTGAEISGTVLMEWGTFRREERFSGKCPVAQSVAVSKDNPPLRGEVQSFLRAPLWSALDSSDYGKILVDLVSMDSDDMRARILMHMLGHSHMDAASLLRKMGSKAVDGIVAAVRAEAASGRISPPSLNMAIRVLGQIGDLRAVEPLSDWVYIPSMSHAAGEALARLGDPRAVAPMLDAFREGRWELATYLAEFPQPEVIDALIAKLDDPATGYTPSQAMAAALAKMAGQDAGGRDAQAWREWFRKHPVAVLPSQEDKGGAP